tara:strand:- start:142 stop:324 length:183 start_codon:yes stop_codon:yes gene_type:complete
MEKKEKKTMKKDDTTLIFIIIAAFLFLAPKRTHAASGTQSKRKGWVDEKTANDIIFNQGG